MGRSTLQGRDLELAALLAGLDDARAGKTRAFALTGEPGIGKTRLTTELAARAAESGFTVCWGRAWEAGGAPPYWPWRLLFESLTAVEPAGPLAQLWGRGGGAPADDPAQARFDLFDAAAAAIGAAASRTPLLCVLDDLHAADVPSLELAAFATRDPRAKGVLWLMTWRDVEADRAPVRDPIARIAREATVLRLPRLSREEQERIISQLGGEVPVEVREALVRSTDGNPLFLVETLACLGTRGVANLARLPLAHGVGAVIRERLEPLAPAVRRILEAASIVGRDVSTGPWSVAADAPAELLRERAAEIVATGILEVVDADRWRFSHELVREAIERETPRDLVIAAHARLAVARDHDVQLGDLSAVGARAHHALLAQGQIEPVTALRWVAAAADHMRTQCAYEEAISLLERAIGAIGPLAREEPGLLLSLGRARSDLGDLPGARASFEACMALARIAGDAEMVARAVLGAGSRYVLGDVRDDLVASIDGATEALPAGARDLRARLLARKAAALTPAARPDEVLAMAREAMQLIATSADSVARLEVAIAVGSTFADFAHPRERMPVNEEAVRMARACGDRALALRGLSRLVTDLLEVGDLARADVLLAQRDQLARSLKLDRFAWESPLFRSMRAMAVRDFAACEAQIAEAREIAARVDDPSVARTIAVHTAWYLLAADRRDELRDFEPTILAALATMPPTLSVVFRAASRWRSGDRQEARREVDRLDPALPHAATNTLATLGEVVAAVGPEPLQRLIHDRLAPHADCRAVWGLFGLTCGPSIAGVVAALAGVLGSGPPTFSMRLVAGSWQIETSGRTFLVRDLRGMPMLAHLTAHPEVEVHALDLVSGRAEGTPDGGDAGELVDRQARKAYLERAAELAEEIEDAQQRGMVARAEAARDELEQLQRELARAVGLGGRARRAGAAAERARITAQRRLREAIRNIGEVDPALGEHLDRCVRTGTYCVYDRGK